jgi:hypothetical protein
VPRIDIQPLDLLAQSKPLIDEQRSNLDALRQQLQDVLRSDPPCPGDGNIDGIVNKQDQKDWAKFAALPPNPLPPDAGNTSSWYDFNFDGFTDRKVLLVIQRNLGQLHHITQERAHHSRRLGRRGAGRRHLDGVVTKVRQPQILQQHAAVGVRVGAHPAGALGDEVGQLGAHVPGPKRIRTRVEVAFIRGRLVSAGSTRRIREIEFELIFGAIDGDATAKPITQHVQACWLNGRIAALDRNSFEAFTRRDTHLRNRAADCQASSA